MLNDYDQNYDYEYAYPNDVYDDADDYRYTFDVATYDEFLAYVVGETEQTEQHYIKAVATNTFCNQSDEWMLKLLRLAQKSIRTVDDAAIKEEMVQMIDRAFIKETAKLAEIYQFDETLDNEIAAYQSLK